MTIKSFIDDGNVGDFPNNKVLEWRPIQFAIEFIYQMRRNSFRLINIPSTRQAIAIPKLISAMYYRKNCLIPDDFIKAAVITTPIEDQKIAKEIAFRLIFPNTPNSSEKEELKQGSKNIDLNGEEKADILDNLLSDFFNSNVDLTNLDTEEYIEKTFQETKNLMDFINEIYDHAGAKEEPYKSLLDILDQRSDFTELLEMGIANIPDLKNYLHQTILSEINTLSPKDVISSVKLGWGDDILDQSKSPWIKKTAEFCMNISNFENSLKQLINYKEAGTSAKILEYLKKAGMEKSKIKSLANQLISKANNLMEISEISFILNRVPPFDKNKIMGNSIKKDIHTSFNISRLLDNKFGANLTNDLFNKWSESTTQPSLNEIFHARTDNPSWQKMLDKCVKDLANDLITADDQSCFKLENLASKLMDFQFESESELCRKSLLKNAQKIGEMSLKESKDPTSFKSVLNSLISKQIPLNQPEILEMGNRLGINNDEIIELFGGTYELIKSMFKNKIGNFQRYNNILKNISKLTNDQLSELMKIAYERENFQALGALGHYNMGKAFQNAGNLGSGAQTKLAESLTAGPGENLLLQWFMHRRSVPAQLKNFVKQLVKDALIKIALSIVSSQRGSGEKGLIPTNSLRTFIMGDDMDLVDIDASIENIVMQGKSLNMITSEDLMVMETEKGRVSICFLLDISGSMSGMKLAACSIAVMVLIGTLRADEVAICFFESNTHVVKEFRDTKSLEDIADELLSLHARGGTQVQSALKWGAHQLEETITEMKICFLLTDCEFFEKKTQIKTELEKYVNQRVKFLLGVNTKSYNNKYANWILNTTQGEMVYILNIMDIPKVLLETLENIG
ncbi:MAG: VWA domain-containing protein [Candidatus Lokiarchaeota archaeon]|nr:VWA domain-containing protein [Candidatus Lokiarchaeota archaeon]